jgi:hypothetical protein
LPKERVYLSTILLLRYFVNKDNVGYINMSKIPKIDYSKRHLRYFNAQLAWYAFWIVYVLGIISLSVGGGWPQGFANIVSALIGLFAISSTFAIIVGYSRAI